MKILLDRKEFTQLLQNAHAYIINKKTTVQAIQGALLEIISEKEIQISSTDVELFLQQKMVADAQADLVGASFILDSKFLTSLLPKLDGDTIILEFLKTTVKVTTETGSYVSAFIDGKDFLELQKMNKEITTVEFSTPVFKNYINKCLPFITRDDDNTPVFSGIHYKMQDKKVLLEAANRATLLQAKDVSEDDANVDILIPAKLAETYLKVYEGEETHIIVDKKRIRIIGENFLLQGTLLEGVFPDLEPLIGSERTGSVDLDKKIVIPALKRILLVNVASKISKWSLGKKELTVEAQNLDLAMKGKEILPYKVSKEMIIGLNPDLVIRALDSFKSEKVTMHYEGEHIATLFDDEDGAVKVLVMPLKL